jgi:ribosomal protein S18 acetylase RimI-like enzyme
MIIYRNNIENIFPEMVTGFFSPSGWKKYPAPEIFLTILENSQHKILAIDNKINIVAGFINAISDKVLSAYIPLLEVKPEYQHRGIGSELVKRMMNEHKDYYMVDLVCDDELESFYIRFGMKKYTAMIKRNYSKQKGIQ